jgi:hypothetical protein
VSIRALLASVLLLSAATAHGQWRQNGDVVPDQAWRKSDGEFGALLLLTDKPDTFLEQWSRPAAPGYAPNIKTVTEARRGDVVAAMILFTRCAPATSGRCASIADFRVIRPDGSIYAEHPGAVLWREAPPGKTALQLGEAHLAFGIEQDDPIGVYKIHATVRDLIGKRSVALVQELTVAPSLAK